MFQRSTGRASVIANAIGRAWLLLANIIMFPIYIKLLGTEQFGLVGILIAITAIVAVFDLGLSPVFARQFNNQSFSKQRRFDLLKTAERLYLFIVIFIASTTFFAPSMWLESIFHGASEYGPQFPELLRLILGIATAQLTLNFYINALSGIEMQVISNTLNIGIGVVRSACVVLPLAFFPDIEIFLWWQLSSTVLGVLVARKYLNSFMQPSDKTYKTRFDSSILIANLPAIRDSFLLALSATLTMNLDRLLVGRFEGLEKISQYTIIAVFSQLILIASAPITMAATPRMIRALTSRNASYFESLLSTTRTSVGIITSITCLIFMRHGTELIQHWTGGSIPSEDINDYAIWLFAGSTALALSSISHCVATANQDYSFGRVYALSVPLVAAAYYFAFANGGLVSGAFAWGCSQILIAIAYLVWIGRRLLHNNISRATPWLGVAVGIVAATLAATPNLFFFEYEDSFIFILFAMGFELFLAILFSVLILFLISIYTSVDDGLVQRTRLYYQIFRNKL